MDEPQIKALIVEPKDLPQVWGVVSELLQPAPATEASSRTRYRRYARR